MNALPESTPRPFLSKRLWSSIGLITAFIFWAGAGCSPSPNSPTTGSTTNPTFTPQSTHITSVFTQSVLDAESTAAQAPQIKQEAVDSPYPPFSFDFDYSRFVWVGMGGFAFESVPGYLVEINVTQSSVSDPSGRILFTLTGSSMQKPISVDNVMAEFMDIMSATFMDLTISETTPVFIQEFKGLSVDIQGYLSSNAFTGRVVTVLPSANNQFLAQAIGMQNGGTDYWLSSGDSDFTAILASLQFFEPTDSACMIADKDDYGYNPEDPIRIGTSKTGDQKHEALYLDNLRGPNFEPVTYQFLRLQTSNQVELQVYQVETPAQTSPILLYLDTKNYQYPRAPKGFKCPQPFNLPPPSD